MAGFEISSLFRFLELVKDHKTSNHHLSEIFIYRALLNLSTNKNFVTQIVKTKHLEEILIPRILSKTLTDEEVVITLNLITNLINQSKSFMKTILNCDE